MPDKFGIKYDQEKPIMSLIPSEAELEEAAVWTFGAKKYGTYNWTNGLDYSRIISAALRHLSAIKLGEDFDPETKLLHAAHVRCCMAMLIYFQKKQLSHLDDRICNNSKNNVDSK